LRLPADEADVRLTLTEAWRRAVAERVEIACTGGHGRTGTALACLAILDGVPSTEAVAFVREHYDPHAVETPGQRRYVAQWQGARSKSQQTLSAWLPAQLGSKTYEHPQRLLASRHATRLARPPRVSAETLCESLHKPLRRKRPVRRYARGGSARTPVPWRGRLDKSPAGLRS
jgi:hypothetical protein